MTGGTIADPRVLRTHRALHDAMVELCLEVGYRAVTVDQLIERAGTTRATFYTHFRDKAHLLAAIADQLVADVLDRFEQQGTIAADRLLMLFEDAERHPERLRVVLRGEGDGVALRLFTERIVDVILDVDQAAEAGGAMAIAVDRHLAARAMAGQIVEVLRWWTETETDADFGERLPIHTVVAQLRTVANVGRLALGDPRRANSRPEEHTT